MMAYRRGDVVLIRFPNSDLKSYKKRPALVVQGDGLPTELPQKIVALITSNLSRTGPTRIPVREIDPAGRTMGLRTDSVVVTDNLTTVLDREIDKAIGHCPVMRDVDQALRLTLGLT
jgi:mRNA interferase MazF